MLVSEILQVKGNTSLYTTSPSDLVRDSVRVMVQSDIGSMIVMDHGKLVGMLTFRELLSEVDRNNGTLGDARVGDVMEKDPLTTDPHCEVMQLRGRMLETHSRYVPVMEGTTLLGVISFHDVARAVYEEQSYENTRLKEYIAAA
jgi:CBS domain-containing protein